MQLGLLAATAAIIILALSGCLSNAPGDKDDASAPTDEDVTQNDPNNGDEPPGPNETVEPLANLTRRFELTGCTYHGSRTQWATSLLPTKTPSGWEPDTPTTTAIFLEFNDCQRFAWDTFERPLFVVFESHDNATAPATCYDATDFLAFSVLHTLWVNDADVVEYLNTNYGIPARYADISYESQELGATTQRTWQLAPQGAEPSTLTFVEPVGTLSEVQEVLGSVWWNGTVLGVLDLDHHISGLEPNPTFARGTMNKPMLYASTGAQDWVGGANTWVNADVQGKVHLWEDTLCTKPI